MRARFQILVPIVLIAVIVIKGCFLPGWCSVIELFIMATLLGVRWVVSEPAVTPEPSQHDIDKMKSAVENLASQLQTVSGTVSEVKNIQAQMRLGGIGRRA